jgi:hypothetical protein
MAAYTLVFCAPDNLNLFRFKQRISNIDALFQYYEELKYGMKYEISCYICHRFDYLIEITNMEFFIFVLYHTLFQHMNVFHGIFSRAIRMSVD